MQERANVSPGSRAWWPVVALLTIMAAFFGEVLLGKDTYYPGDIARLYLPQRQLLARALEQGALPWWTSQMGAGYPLIAGGETGALYPLNLLLTLVAAPARALSLGIVVHYVIMGLGLFYLARLSGILPGPSAIGGVTLTLGGFAIAHLSHPSIMAVSAWMPWLLALSRGVIASPQPRRARLSAVGLSMAVAMQFLAGHAQMSLLILLPTAAYALLLPWVLRIPLRVKGTAVWVSALLVGMALASPQLLASAELAALSQRAGGLTGSFFTSYSFHPLLAATLVSPFALGNPYPEGTVEFMAYMGLLPLMLAWLALARHKSLAGRSSGVGAGRREMWFFAGMAAVGFALSMGRWNPLYDLLQRIPVLNLFRVPARYLIWTCFGIAVLAAYGADLLVRSSVRRQSRAGWLLVALLGASLFTLTAFVSARLDTERLITVWRWLPLPLVLVSGGAVLLVRLVPRRIRGPVLLAVLCADLYAYGLVLDQTYNATWPLQDAQRATTSSAFFRAHPGSYRIYTKEEILPDLKVARESHYPNMAAGAGLSGANLYSPLVPKLYGDYVADLDANRLNKLGVRYYLIPQLLPVDQESELYDVLNPYSSLPYDAQLAFPSFQVTAIEVESYLSHSADVADGETVALITLGGDPGHITMSLKAGLDTAEWAYDRDDVAKVIAHAKPDVATTFPASSGFPPREHPGHTYRTVLALPSEQWIDSIRVHPERPEAFVRIERVWAHTAAGERILLNHLVGRGNHRIVYRSEDVLVYQNEDALPRAFALADDLLVLNTGGVTLPERLLPDQVIPASLVEYADASLGIKLDVDAPSHLIVADLNYPGWSATLDGGPVEIREADGLFRALPLSPGAHQVDFSYLPPHHPTRLLRGRASE